MQKNDHISKRDLHSLLLFVLVRVSFMILPIIFWQQIVMLFSSIAAVEEFVDRFSIWAVLGFIATQVLQVIFFVVPSNIIQISGGYLFGLPLATLYSFIGISLGMMINYFIGNKLGASFIKRMVREEIYDTVLLVANSLRTLVTVIILFLIPGAPKDIIAFVAGALQVRFRRFMIASLTARLPLLISSVAVGASLSNEQWVLAIVLSIIAVVLFVVGVIFRKRLKQRFLGSEVLATKADPESAIG